ncbi:hypothetical protein B5S33_g5575 [[Candida] boidinii]|nr:hypothetical protein B5S30_g5304 [[Candida] boidinii]OWB86856.1 hypothetical protein B5S33_g5575 [[Candida] boidinii]GMG15574.1 unnamed protein product [[Candida] boidinii]
MSTIRRSSRKNKGVNSRLESEDEINESTRKVEKRKASEGSESPKLKKTNSGSKNQNGSKKQEKEKAKEEENKAHNEEEHKEDQEVINKQINEDEDEVRCLVCGTNDMNFDEEDDPYGNMIQCEKCNTWQHIKCMLGRKKIPDPYYCDVCNPENPQYKKLKLHYTFAEYLKIRFPKTYIQKMKQYNLEIPDSKDVSNNKNLQDQNGETKEQEAVEKSPKIDLIPQEEKNKIRESVAKTFKDLFIQRIPKEHSIVSLYVSHEVLGINWGNEIENELFKAYPNDTEYRQKSRMYFLNIKNEKTKLLDKLLSKDLTFKDLVRLSEEEMRTEEIKKAAVNVHLQSIKQTVLKTDSSNSKLKVKRTHKGEEVIEDENDDYNTISNYSTTEQNAKQRVLEEQEEAERQKELEKTEARSGSLTPEPEASGKITGINSSLINSSATQYVDDDYGNGSVNVEGSLDTKITYNDAYGHENEEDEELHDIGDDIDDDVFDKIINEKNTAKPDSQQNETSGQNGNTSNKDVIPNQNEENEDEVEEEEEDNEEEDDDSYDPAATVKVDLEEPIFDDVQIEFPQVNAPFDSKIKFLSCSNKRSALIDQVGTSKKILECFFKEPRKTDSLNEHGLQLLGRLDRTTAYQYLNKITTTRDLYLLELEPFKPRPSTSELEIENNSNVFLRLWQYFIKREKEGVIGNRPAFVKDGYIICLNQQEFNNDNNNIPEFFNVFNLKDELLKDTSRKERMFVILVVQKDLNFDNNGELDKIVSELRNS